MTNKRTYILLLGLILINLFCVRGQSLVWQSEGEDGVLIQQEEELKLDNQ
jgi:hypothetical protein